MTSLLTYKNVDILYGGFQAVSNVSFSLDEGQILGIVGQSGSGKTTLIKAAMGLLGERGLVAHGDIFYKDQNLVDISENDRRKINGPELGFVFQNSGASFCPIRTVASQLYEIMREHRPISKDEFFNTSLELLNKLAFKDGMRILNSYPFELSGGMQQRVGIVAAMLLKPKLLFADEPTSALDVSVQRQVLEEILYIRENFDTSIVMVTHNIAMISAIADKLLIMKEGKLVEYGDTEEILKNPQAEYTKSLLAAVPVLRRA